MNSAESFDAGTEIAIVGMAGRFPGARNVDEFWRNLRDGVESITFFTEPELLAAGVAPETLRDQRYVKAKGTLADVELFDAAFFGINPREAEIMDPQHRIFLECAWEALENAGYAADTYAERIGVYAGLGLNSYLLSNLYSNRHLITATSGHQSLLGNDKDFLTTRVSYKLNLRGPSISVQTACSTSLVAVHLACQSLLNGECGLALAGGVTIAVPQTEGYRYEEGSILSPDGHCRAFDAGAGGTVSGSGAGIVVLKRLEDAFADGDAIHAIIKGSAINNDGSLKAGYTAPSVEGQAAVIGEALHMAGVPSSSISYVEAHGTATVLGDPVEVAALSQAFRADTTKKGFCALGSVKTNIGHLDTAAGVAGLIKTVLALKHQQLPPSLHFRHPNPAIDFDDSPFYVNSELNEWKTNGEPRRAGVSSFGIGGTNAHVILEEAPTFEHEDVGRPSHLLLLSAKTSSALRTAASNLAEHLRQHPQLNLADVAYTLQAGREPLDHRMMLVCRDTADAVAALEAQDASRVTLAVQETNERPVVFMLPGQGAQHVGMSRGLYESESVFREQVDLCAGLLRAQVGSDLRALLFPPAEQAEEAATQLTQTRYTQPALFIVEYALARLWMKWGVQPRAMIGHSVGEYVAACLAGVMSLEDALALVAARGRLMQGASHGAMLSVSLPEREVVPLLDERLSLAAVNGPSFCVVAGETEAVEELERRLTGDGRHCRRLHTSHAFHSRMMEPILAPFGELVKATKLNPPRIPYISNLTGATIKPEEATDPLYWVRQLRETVRFDAGLRELFQIPQAILLEVGPGQTLHTLARRHEHKKDAHGSIATLPRPQEQQTDAESIMRAAGEIWLAGRRLDWLSFNSDRRNRRVPLPTYPFERTRYWIEPQPEDYRAKPPAATLDKRADINEWLYAPLWKQTTAPVANAWESSVGDSRWLVFMNEGSFATRLAERLEAAGAEVVRVNAGAQFARHNASEFTIDAGCAADYERLLKELVEAGGIPDRMAHLWGVTPVGASARMSSEELLRHSFYSLLFLAQALGKGDVSQPVRLDIVTNNMQCLAGETELFPEKATTLAPCRVIPQEYPNITCRSIDLVVPTGEEAREVGLIKQLLAELAAPQTDAVVTYREGTRWVKMLEPLMLPEAVGAAPRLRDEGVYLITGGLGGIGLEIADWLAQTARAKLVLTARMDFPSRERWGAWTETHGESDAVSKIIRRLLSLEAHGAEVLALSADVTDRQRMEEVVARTRERFGEINAVVHAAGVEGGGMIQLKTPEMAAAVLAPKVQGLRVLESILEDVSLDFIVLCSSLSSVLGGVGQLDYCAANFFLDAYAQADARRHAGRTISINWDAWQQAGMAARRALGASHPSSPAGASPHSLEHPLLSDWADENAERRVYTMRLSVHDFWVLDEHRIAGHALLPGTAYLEIARAAFEAHAGAGELELRDIYFLNIMRVGEDEIREAQTILEREADGFKFVIRSRREGDAMWQEHAVGQVARLTPEPLKKHDLKKLAARCNRELDLTTEGFAAEGLGPRWGGLKSVRLGSGELLTRFELPTEFSADLEHYKLHPALLDLVTGVAKQHLGDGSTYLPLSYRAVKIHSPLSQRLYGYAKARDGNDRQSEAPAFDIIILDEEGRELVEVLEFTAKKVNDSAALIKAFAASDQPGRTDTSANNVKGTENPPVTPASGHHTTGPDLTRGILPAEGVEVLSRILSGRAAPQVVVSTADVHALIENVGALTKAKLTEQAEKLYLATPKSVHPRPELQTPYVAPSGEVENLLAEIWQSVLGIESVGAQDNLFELGGDSVVAIYIVARANEAGLKLSPQQLFNNPTVAGLAAATEHQPAVEDTYAPSAFELANLDERKLEQLSKLLDDDDVEDDEEEFELAESEISLN